MRIISQRLGGESPVEVNDSFMIGMSPIKLFTISKSIPNFSQTFVLPLSFLNLLKFVPNFSQIFILPLSFLNLQEQAWYGNNVVNKSNIVIFVGLHIIVVNSDCPLSRLG